MVARLINVTQQQIEATWERVAKTAFEYWNERNPDDWRIYANPPTYRAAIEEAKPSLSRAMRDPDWSKQLIQTVTFRIHRMRHKFGGTIVVECLDPHMIVYKGD